MVAWLGQPIKSSSDSNPSVETAAGFANSTRPA